MTLPPTMQAGQWDPAQARVVVNTVPVPAPGPDEMLVRIASASLCHTDLIAIDRPGLTAPFTIGHEAVGRVAALHASSADKGFAVGDPVGFLYIRGCCFACEGCQVHNLLCLRGTPELSGFTQPGFFAEFAVVDRRNAVRLPPALGLATSSVFFCAGATAFHALDGCGLAPGQWVAVVGAGGLGQLATQYAKAMGLRVAAVDVHDATLAVVRAQGADAVFNARTDPDYAATLKALTPLRAGAHAVAVFSNAPAAYASAPPLVRPGGVLMCIGLPDEPLQFPAMDLALGRYRVKSAGPGLPAQLPRVVAFSAAHRIQPAVARRRLDELGAMVAEMRAGTATKRMVVVFDEGEADGGVAAV